VPEYLWLIFSYVLVRQYAGVGKAFHFRKGGWLARPSHVGPPDELSDLHNDEKKKRLRLTHGRTLSRVAKVSALYAQIEKSLMAKFIRDSDPHMREEHSGKDVARGS